ncbi:Non-LTR retrotransposon CATS [Operophtera brumata]|uniref:Non-LTR retrotransposon CATS n=1 Tax=Operophtera brumata TaxID=104452 RepID=A0A0L7KZ69_OPEBR|nr:Non-LTR retrotransposon CATS [Operophtera brumata]
MSHVIGAGLKKVVILSDSRSALQHVARCASGFRGASIAYTILNKVLVLISQGASLRLQWIPSHVGLRGNEVADTLAREAISNGTEVFIKPDYSEVLHKYKRCLRSKLFTTMLFDQADTEEEGK